MVQFLAARHVGSQLPNQGSNPQPLHWKQSPKHGTTREVTWDVFVVIGEHVQRGEMGSGGHKMMHFLWYSFLGSVSSTYFSFLCFWWLSVLFKMAPWARDAVLCGAAVWGSCMCEAVLRLRGKRVCYTGFLQAWVPWAAGREVNAAMRQYTLSNVCLDRNTHKTRWCMDWGWKCARGV